MSTTTDNPTAPAEQAVPTATVPRKAYEALRKAGHKYSELSDEQKARAVQSEATGYGGKTLADWIVNGSEPAKSFDEKAAEGDAAAKQTRAGRPASGAAGNGSSAQPRASRYPDEVRAAVKRANEIRGKSHGAGPKQHATVREVVRKELGLAGTANPTVQQVLDLAGVKSQKALVALADGTAGREEMKVLRPLAGKMGDDGWCKGRHLAAELAAWVEQIKG